MSDRVYSGETTPPVALRVTRIRLSGIEYGELTMLACSEALRAAVKVVIAGAAVGRVRMCSNPQQVYWPEITGAKGLETVE